MRFCGMSTSRDCKGKVSAWEHLEERFCFDRRRYVIPIVTAEPPSHFHVYYYSPCRTTASACYCIVCCLATTARLPTPKLLPSTFITFHKKEGGQQLASITEGECTYECKYVFL